MDCEVTGLPLPVVTWFKGNKPIRSSHKFVTERNTLRINSIMIQDAGVYSCEAKNQAGMCKNHKKSLNSKISRWILRSNMGNRVGLRHVRHFNTISEQMNRRLGTPHRNRTIFEMGLSCGFQLGSFWSKKCKFMHFGKIFSFILVDLKRYFVCLSNIMGNIYWNNKTVMLVSVN